MCTGEINDFTANTYFKMFWRKNIEGQFSVFKQKRAKPGFDKLLEIVLGDFQREKINFENGRTVDEIFELTEFAKFQFIEFCQDSDQILKQFVNRQEYIIELLNYEIEAKKNFQMASYIQIPFDEQRNNIIINYIYKSLNGECFNTSKENFQKIFTPDNSFTKIRWLCEMNLLVKLFTGFNYVIDGFSISFPGIMKETSNKWMILADKFHIERKGNKVPLPQLLAGFKSSIKQPRRLTKLLPFVKYLQKAYSK